jgi:DNA-binding response OmpR family regulator
VDDRLKILVVEDDPVYAEFIVGTLREAMHDVDHVTSAAAARDNVGHGKPDVVMLDLVLPDGSGYDLARALRRDLPAASIIIVLTADQFPQRDLADAVGIDLVLTKPVQASVVAGMIDLIRTRRRRKLAGT